MKAHISSCNPSVGATLQTISLPESFGFLSGYLELKAAFIQFNLVTFLHMKLTYVTSFIPYEKVNTIY